MPWWIEARIGVDIATDAVEVLDVHVKETIGTAEVVESADAAEVEPTYNGCP